MQTLTLNTEPAHRGALIKGLNCTELSPCRRHQDLDQTWEVLSTGMTTSDLRSECLPLSASFPSAYHKESGNSHSRGERPCKGGFQKELLIRSFQTVPCSEPALGSPTIPPLGIPSPHDDPSVSLHLTVYSAPLSASLTFLFWTFAIIAVFCPS